MTDIKVPEFMRKEMMTIDLEKEGISMRQLTPLEEEEITNRIKAMDHAELEVVINTIPIEYCLARIEKEILRQKAFNEAILNVIKIM